MFPLVMFQRKQQESLEKFLSESMTADAHIYCQSWFTKWWESEIVKNPIRNKILGQVHILYSQWLLSKCLVSGMEISFLKSVMVLSSRGATVPEISKTQHEDYSVFSMFLSLFFFLFKESIFYSKIYVIIPGYKVKV